MDTKIEKKLIGDIDMSITNAFKRGNFDLSNLQVDFAKTLSPRAIALRKIGLLIQMRDNDFKPEENSISEIEIDEYKRFLKMTAEERETELFNLQKDLRNVSNPTPK